jgi:spermidine synthase
MPMPLLYAIIFVTGGAILALELLASRVMTPYFGVSLYIWTGILSITLVALAAGYWWGGRLATSLASRGRGEKLCSAYLLMPPVSALAIVGACVTYPYLFPLLATYDLVVGAFVACLVLLAIPLATTSAMNPLLVAMLVLQPAGPDTPADAGSGRVFFVSTVGSVAGVVATAFLLIPNLSNFSALLAVAVTLALLPMAALANRARVLEGRRGLTITAVVALVVSSLMFWKADAFLARMWPVKYAGTEWSIEASVGSMFGTVKVLRSAPVDDSGRFVRVYFQDGLIQNRSLSDGTALTFYTYALEALSIAHQPKMRTALVLGLGAGVVPTRLAARGVEVTAVEIDPASFDIARRYFGFDAARVRAVQADARTYLRGCKGQYDTVVVDLFHGDGTPDYLVTRDFFAELRNCLAPGAVAVFNTFADLTQPRSYAHLLATLRTAFPFVVLYRPDDPGAKQVNSFIVAATAPLSPEQVNLHGVPPRYADDLAAMLRHPQQLDRSLLEGGEVISDARSAASRDIALVQMAYRRHVAEQIPAAFLLN